MMRQTTNQKPSYINSHTNSHVNTQVNTQTSTQTQTHFYTHYQQKSLHILSSSNQSLAEEMKRLADHNPFIHVKWNIDVNEIRLDQASSPTSILDDLRYQLATLNQKHDPRVCEYIIETLDDHGFLSYPISEYCEQLHISEEAFYKELAIVQTFEPFGIASKNSIDFIIKQLQKKEDYLSKEILTNYDKQIIRKEYEVIAQGTKVTEQEVMDALKRIRKCELYPCEMSSTDSTHFHSSPSQTNTNQSSNINNTNNISNQENINYIYNQNNNKIDNDNHNITSSNINDSNLSNAKNNDKNNTKNKTNKRKNATTYYNDYIIPDIIVNLTDIGLYIEPYQLAQIESTSYTADMSDEWKEYFKDAKVFIDAFHHRNQTLLRVANELFKIQETHFLYNDPLQACTLKQISNITELHISTISRSIQGKYYEFQGQLKPLKSLLTNRSINNKSEFEIKALLNHYIKHENKRYPYSDQELQELFQRQGIQLSRRVITKYRKDMNIPNNYQRSSRIIIKE